MDAINLTSQIGAASYFLTITTNPNWREIQENLQVGETAIERPDLMARVFHEKLMAFLNDITKTDVLGKSIGRIYAENFKKVAILMRMYY
jgi:hypothetical protein